MHEHTSFVDLMSARVHEHGDRVALVHSADPLRPGSEETLTYAELDTGARRAAALLQDRFAAGERVLVLQPTGPGFARAFLACMYAGMIPVSAPPPDGYRRQARRLAAIARDARVAAVLADGTDRDLVSSWAKEQDLEGLDLLSPDSEDLPGADAWRRPPADPRAPALLQYTSGSTDAPKGVVVDHANLLVNARNFARLTGVDPDRAVGGWLPMYHDFGLIGTLLTPLVIGTRSVLMPPLAFLKRPASWLALIDRHGVDTSPAPNFAYDMCVDRVTDEELAGLDLSRWRLAVNGAEPIRAATVRRFTERFAAAGLRPSAMLPGYGMAEATLVVSGNAYRSPVVSPVDPAALERGEFVPAAGDPAAQPLVGCGRPGPVEARICDPESGEVLPDGRVGEIWVRGRNVARGYWERPEETAEVFGAVAADGEGGFLRTGDLGVLYEGELYVTGRCKELIIVRGRNLYPQDLEAATRDAHPALARGVAAAFSVPAPDEQVVIVRECRARGVDPAGLAEIVAAIRDRVAADFGVPARGVVLVRPGGIARTTSGKIQRRLMREDFLKGRLDAVHADLSPAVRAVVEEAR